MEVGFDEVFVFAGLRPRLDPQMLRVDFLRNVFLLLLLGRVSAPLGVLGKEDLLICVG